MVHSVNMGCSHLLIYFCASAGKNGEDLGLDEEQIVLFVYLLFDVTNCKVSIQLHFYLVVSYTHCIVYKCLRTSYNVLRTGVTIWTRYFL